VRVELLLDDDTAFVPGRIVVLKTADRECRTEIEFFRRQHRNCVIKLRDINSISEAEKWVGAEVLIASNALSLAAGWFYTFQLKGCDVFDAGGDYVGQVTDVMDLGGSEVLKVEGSQTETLIPFAQAYLKKIDLDQKRIEVNLPDDLRQLNK